MRARRDIPAANVLVEAVALREHFRKVGTLFIYVLKLQYNVTKLLRFKLGIGVG